MQEAIESETPKASITRVIKATMNQDTRFMCHNDSELHFAEYSRVLDKGEFEKRVIMETYFRLKDAYIILGIHSMGHASLAHVRLWLSLYAKSFPDKDVPTFGHVGGENELRTRLKHLCMNGLLAGQVFVSTAKVVDVYSCTNYGHLYFRNQLDMYSMYDQSAIMRSFFEINKRLAANSVTLSFAKQTCCTKFQTNERIQGESRDDLGYAYGTAILSKGEASKRFLVEPAYFSFDKERMTEEECSGKLEKRLEKLQEMVAKNKDGIPTRLVFVMENLSGLKKFEVLLRPRGIGVFYDALYTSEAVIRSAKEDLKSSFLSIAYMNGVPRLAHGQDPLF